MSAVAVAAFYRLMVAGSDGTSLYVLYHFAWKHDERRDVAYPSISGMCADLKLPRQTLLDAIGRLEASRLITVSRQKAGGRGRNNEYTLPWLRIHRVDPSSKEPIIWGQKKQSGPPDPSCTETVRSTGKKQSGPPDLLCNETVRSTGKKGLVDRQETVRSTRRENNKNIKTPPPSAQKGAGGTTRTAQQVFDETLAKKQTGASL